jgi:DNA invertase Pin-like site-specific DNA recombinase
MLQELSLKKALFELSHERSFLKQLAVGTSHKGDPKMMIGYARISKADGSQVTDLQTDSLKKAGVDQVYEDKCSGKLTQRPELDACFKALRKGDTLVVWRIDRLGRDTRHLIDVVVRLKAKGVGLRVLSGIGDGEVDTSTANGQMIFNIFATLAEFERNLIVERTKAGLDSARARGRKGGAIRKFTKTKLLMACASMAEKCHVGKLCKEISISRATLYRYVHPDGSLTEMGQKVKNNKDKDKDKDKDKVAI